MTRGTVVADVKGMEEIRSSLPSILATLRRTPEAEPVHFGSHRRDEAVLLSRERYEQQSAAVRELEELERLGALQLVRDRLGDGRFSEGTVDELFDVVDRPA
jgi:PHD/YefM family antitoxin component YafN of YafNO toxin-antitoxin module